MNNYTNESSNWQVFIVSSPELCTGEDRIENCPYISYSVIHCYSFSYIPFLHLWQWIHVSFGTFIGFPKLKVFTIHTQ